MRHPRSTKIHEVKSLCSQILKLEDDTYIRSAISNESGFRDYVHFLNSLFYLVRSLDGSSLDHIPEPYVEDLIKVLRPVQDYLTKVRAGSANGSLNSTGRDWVPNTLTAVSHNLYNIAAPVIAFSRQHGTDLQEAERQAREARDRLLELENEGARLYQELLDHRVENAVSKQANFFDQQAKAHERGGWVWLGILVVIAGVVIWAAMYFVDQTKLLVGPDAKDITAGQAIILWVPRFVVLSVLFWALTLASRNYRAHRHNAVANRHRHVSLSTFGYFASATTDAAAKAAVLTQAASTIFSPQPTGYSPDAPDQLPHATAIELVQRLSKPSGPTA